MKKLIYMLPLLVSCGGEEMGGSVETELCEHMREGPAVAVTATSSTAAGPDVSEEHMRFDVALGDFSGMNGGYVIFKADEATDFVLAMDALVPVAITRIDGTQVSIEETVNGATECSEIAVQHTIPLEVGSAIIQLGPTERTSVSLVIEESDHGEHEAALEAGWTR